MRPDARTCNVSLTIVKKSRDFSLTAQIARYASMEVARCVRHYGSSFRSMRIPALLPTVQYQRASNCDSQLFKVHFCYVTRTKKKKNALQICIN